MKGDFTRTTFQAEKRYSRVLMQQGRVQMDADWNEQLDITAHRVETETVDTIGQCGGSIHDAGFRLVADKSELTDEEKATLLEEFGALTLGEGDFLITSGRYYIDGILVENEDTLRQTRQTDLAEADPISGDGYHLVYLDVWQRHITKLEDADIREVALGGPDTATRMKTIWQVRHMKVADIPENADDAPMDCSLFGTDPDWIPIEDPRSSALVRGKLQAQAAPPEGEEGPCIVPPEAGYTRLENQLYRVEIHDPTIDPAGPTFKWSRENGNIVVRMEDIQGDVLIVSAPGKDEVLDFAPGQWVELSDEERVLKGEPGVLVRLAGVEGVQLTVGTWPDGPLTMAHFGALPTVRRWDMPGNTEGALEVNPADPNFLDLESGVQIKFEGEQFRTGDYWLIPARTVVGDLLWPRENGSPSAEEPHGIQHHFCSLALVKFDSDTPSPSLEVIHDCRELFAPLTEQIHFYQIGGTGQEAMPGETLLQSLQVGVANGQWPVDGAKVKFETVPDDAGLGGGTLHADGDSGASLVVLANGDGVAACDWELDTDPEHHSQRVVATLLTPAESAVDGIIPLAFNAYLSLADHVFYDPSDACLNPEPTSTVEEALDDLCENFTLYYVGGDGQEVMPSGDLTKLPAPMQVRVANRQWPVEDDRAGVRFEIVEGDGELSKVGVALPGVTTLDVQLGPEGLAQCDWHVDDSTEHQQVAATLIDASGELVVGNSPIRFNAGLKHARFVGYDPAECPPFDGVDTVQDAIDELCRLESGREPGISIRNVLLAQNRQLLFNDMVMPVRLLSDGILVQTDKPIDVASLRSKPTCFVTIDLPFPLVPDEPGPIPVPRGAVVGFRPLILAATIGTTGTFILWKPLDHTAKYLEDVVQAMGEAKRGDLLAHLTLKGNFIWGSEAAELHLDGETLGRPRGDGRTILAFPSGDGRPGGDFEMWFWLAEPRGGIGALVNLNNATVAELVALPGVGPALADAIVAGRPYAGVEDLISVSGISERRLVEIRDLVFVEES